jgi:hypothetical protein
LPIGQIVDAQSNIQMLRHVDAAIYIEIVVGTDVRIDGIDVSWIDKFGLPLVNSDFNLPIWRQFSDSSKSWCVSQVVRSRWRQRGTGEVGPAPEQFGP